MLTVQQMSAKIRSHYSGLSGGKTGGISRFQKGHVALLSQIC